MNAHTMRLDIPIMAQMNAHAMHAAVIINPQVCPLRVILEFSTASLHA